MMVVKEEEDTVIIRSTFHEVVLDASQQLHA